MSATRDQYRLLLLALEEDAEADGHATPPAVPEDTWRIRDEDDAQWVVGLMVEADAAIERHQAQAAARLAELKGRRDRLSARFGADLEAWAKEEAARRGRRSVTLLTGTVAFRKVPGRLSISDAELAQARADETGMEGAFETRRVFLPAVYREAAQFHLEETGELLPGVEIVPERDSMSVGVTKPKAAKAAPAQEGGEG